jgi:hypothetical protein
MSKTLFGACLILVGMLFFAYVSTWGAGTTANMHPGSDITHTEDDPYTQLYQCRIDSGIAWGTAADSNQFIGEWNTNWTRLPAGAIGFTYMVRLTAIDTTLTMNDNDSIWISVETSSNPNSWYPNINTIHEFDPVLDTCTQYKHFPPDSSFVQVQFGYVRTEIVYHCWQDSLDHGSICDTLSHTPMYLEETIIPIF